MRALADMLEPLVRVVMGSDARHANAWVAYERAADVGPRLPLVHRTYKPGAEIKWRELLAKRTFAADDPCTAREKAAGIPRAAYFFLGCGAYPDGLVGFVLDAPAVLVRNASFTPFDTGSLQKYVVPRDPARRAAWDDPARDRFLADHLCAAGALTAFAGPYIAAHFQDAMTYVARGQWTVPDFPAYHGLECINGDRRAWTIEVQVHEDVPFAAGDPAILEIVAARRALIEDLPDDLVAVTRLARAENEVLETIAAQIAARLLGAP